MNTQMMRETGASRPAGLIATPAMSCALLLLYRHFAPTSRGRASASEFQTQQTAAKENTRQLRQVIDLIPQQIFILEPDSSALFENQTAREYFGPLEADSPKERMIEVTHSDDLEAGVVGAYESALSTGRSHLRRKPG